MFEKYKIVLNILIIITLCSCTEKKKSKSTRSLITEISVRKIKIPGEVGFLSDDFIKKSVNEILEKSSAFPYKPGAQTTRPWILEIKWFVREVAAVRSRLVDGQIHDRATETGVEIILRPLFKDEKSEPFRGINEKYVTFSKIAPGDIGEKLKESLVGNIRAAMETILSESTLVQASDEEILRNLKSSEDSIRLSALVIVGRRELNTAAPVLIEMLRKENDMSVKLRIAGVLGILKDTKSVEALSELALVSSEEHAVVIMNIIGNIGGKRAITFLRWMESSHHSRIVRKGAENILVRLNLK
ncbi:hypothetical protein KKF34_19895 [Myxococcota bacterium]|nr:hypothetical protein [Myxococcota bacterium]MBU1380854.1 hypothetical protein [Myxococcota bacterium]MBU1499151.1 hypothetical protein [Myxococcota bacterium]